jgi:predicted nucleic acid-binding protein
MKPTVYLETSVISYLFVKPSRHSLHAAHHQLTVDWWQQIQPQVDCFISSFVMEEISKGDIQTAQRRVKAVSHLPVLQHHDEIEQLAHTYFTALSLPKKAELDAFHLATAVWYKLDYLLSWNSKHIVGTRVKKIVQDLNRQYGRPTPIICTPEDFTEI